MGVRSNGCPLTRSMAKNRRPSRPISSLAPALIILLGTAGGCRSLAELAPPVTPSWAEAPPADVAALERGREIYITTCASCHRVAGIEDHSLESWRALLPEMLEKSSLEQRRAADLRAYVLAARRRVDQAAVEGMPDPRPDTGGSKDRYLPRPRN